MAAREREVELSDRMSEHEALMWNIEKDPWLNPNGASLTILDQPVDLELFRRHIRHGMSKMPRLYQRVVPGLGRLSTPAWVVDTEFDFDYHVREIELPGAGTERQLLDLVTALYEEPLDRTRPLWRFVSIRGVEGGRGAVWSLTHHAIADGIGQLRMAELYQQTSRDEEPPAEVDLAQLLARAVSETGAKESGGDLATSLMSTTTRTVGHLIRRQAGIGRRVMGEMMLWPGDIDRATTKVGDIANTARSTTSILSGSNNEIPGGSPLWQNRSRHRHLEYVQVPLDGLKQAAKMLGGSINDAFMIGLTEGAVRYHAERDTVVDAFNTSFVLSTRTDSKMGGNSFTPVLVQVPGHPGSFETRMSEIRTAIADAREKSERGGGISGLSGVINLLPTSVVTRTARSQAGRIDFATSNLRGAPFPLFCAGAKVLATVCMGPVAGTAANATGLSYDGNFDIGLFLDPVAIDDPEAYRRCVERSFADLVDLGRDTTAVRPSKPQDSASATPHGADDDEVMVVAEVGDKEVIVEHVEHVAANDASRPAAPAAATAAPASNASNASAERPSAKKAAPQKKRAVAAPVKKKAVAKKATAKKATAKKATAKKATAKKAPAKRATAKKATTKKATGGGRKR